MITEDEIFESIKSHAERERNGWSSTIDSSKYSKICSGGGTTLLHEQARLFSIRAWQVFSKERNLWLECKAEAKKLFCRKERKLYQIILRQEWFYRKKLFYTLENPRVGFKRFFRTGDRLYRKGRQV